VHFLVTVAVLVQAPSGDAAARQSEAEHALVAAERARGADVVDDALGLYRQGWTAKRHLDFFSRGAGLVSDGRAALARVELARAEKLLADAEAIYEPEAARPGVRQEWAEAAKWHGVALVELKRRDEAIAAWQRARSLEPDTQLTDAMVRPDVARLFAAVQPTAWRPKTVEHPSDADDVETQMRTLGLDEILVAAIAFDGDVIHYAATRRAPGCGTDTLTGTRADELVRRLHEARCRPGVPLAITPPEIAPRRAAVAVERRARVWQRPWFWVTLVGAVGVGVVVAVNVWPRDPSYSTTLDFHQFALGRR
jgi:hypothetical protein